MVSTATYEAALKRANDEGLYIRDFGADAHGTYWQVVNPKYSSGWYTVRLHPSGRYLTCNCAAGQRGQIDKPCKHRAYVHAWEVERREEGASQADVDDQNRADAHSLRYELSALTRQRDDDRWLNGR